MPTGLDEFKSVIKDYRSLTFYQVNGTLVLPLADFATKVGPPWPPFSPLWTTLVETIVLLVLFQSSFQSTKKVLVTTMRRALLFSFVSAILFLIGNSMFVFDSKNVPKDVKGFVVIDDVKPVLTPVFKEQDALEGANWDPTKVWTLWSITVVRVGLFVTWIALFGSLTRAIGAFVILQRRPRG